MQKKYIAPSSKGDKNYIVTVSIDPVSGAHGVSNCTCTGWKYRHQCHHADDVNADASKFKEYKEGAVAAKPVVQGATGKFRKPMLAATVELEQLNFIDRVWFAEEKFDGHRLIVSVVNGESVTAWARSGKERELPAHLKKALLKFPTGLYDGELCVPHGRSYNVTELERAKDRAYVIFDVLEVVARDITSESYQRRREALQLIFAAAGKQTHVLLAESTRLRSKDEARKLFKDILSRDGEGLILKESAGKYLCGDRPKHIVKMKNVMSAVLRCVGYKAGKLGPYSTLRLKDNDGNTTSVKVRNLKWLAEVNKNPKRNIGRKVRIEFQERTPGGGYRGPVRMDRWEDQ